jgi:hypothetical protein
MNYYYYYYYCCFFNFIVDIIVIVIANTPCRVVQLTDLQSNGHYMRQPTNIEQFQYYTSFKVMVIQPMLLTKIGITPFPLN